MLAAQRVLGASAGIARLRPTRSFSLTVTLAGGAGDRACVVPPGRKILDPDLIDSHLGFILLSALIILTQ
jgi:hypothetical protein